jgi:putative ABC transport system permease protein
MVSQSELYHLLLSAINDFKRNKVRTFLTSLGIMIGVLSVVMLLALGLGLKNYIKNQFESLGANLVMVMPGSGFSSGSGFGAGLVNGVKFDEKDVSSLKRIPEADYVVPLFFKGSSVEGGGEKKFGYIQGTNVDYFKIMNAKVISGEIFGQSDLTARAKKAVLGYELARKLFKDPKDAVGRTIRLDSQRFKVIGVLEKKGDNETDNGVVVPYKTTFGNLNPDKSFWSIYLGTSSKENVPALKKKAEEILLKRYKEDDFSVTEQSEILSMVNQIFNILNSVLIAIGSISLLVGGIGIMNIMYATVTERTKEIGIRRAIGATERDILLQFMTESVVLSLFGGILGLVLAGIIVLITRFFFPASLNIFSVVITFVISSAIGIFFGVFPARRAAKLPPIEAIRYE